MDRCAVVSYADASALHCHARPCLSAAAVGGSALCLCMGVKGDACALLRFSNALLFTSIAWLLPCPNARFTAFPLGDKAMQILFSTRLHFSGAVPTEAIPMRSKTALLRGGERRGRLYAGPKQQPAILCRSNEKLGNSCAELSRTMLFQCFPLQIHGGADQGPS